MAGNETNIIPRASLHSTMRPYSFIVEMLMASLAQNTPLELY
jgi:hypothetical protein